MVAIWIVLWTSFLSYGAEYSKEVEKDYSLRSIGHLQVTNARGDVSVRGWSQDKIRVKVRKRVTASTPDEAKLLLDTIDYRFSASGENIEISSQYGSNLSIEQRLQEKQSLAAKMDITVYAPSRLKLGVWSNAGKIEVLGWNSSAEVRSKEGMVRIDGLKGTTLVVSCKGCAATLKNIRAEVRGRGGAGEWDLNHIEGSSVYVETEQGSIKATQVRGPQLYVSQSGDIQGQTLNGEIEFRTNSGRVGLRDLAGCLSGFSQAGDISARITTWKATDKALIESGTGSIDLTFPRSFASDIDLWSVRGTTSIDFPWQKTEDTKSYGPEPTTHVIGRIRTGGEVLKVFSQQGDIRLLKADL